MANEVGGWLGRDECRVHASAEAAGETPRTVRGMVQRGEGEQTARLGSANL